MTGMLSQVQLSLLCAVCFTHPPMLDHLAATTSAGDLLLLLGCLTQIHLKPVSSSVIILTLLCQGCSNTVSFVKEIKVYAMRRLNHAARHN